jgi:hypothetical protein
MTPTGTSANGLPVLEQKNTGARRILGCRPTKPKLGAPPWKELHAVTPQENWKEVDWRKSGIGAPVLNQHQSNACVGFASATAFTVAWRLHIFDPDAPEFEFSPWFVYGNINGGRDEGSSIGEALDSLHTDGICFNSDVPEGTLFQSDFSDSAFQTAKRFHIKRAIQCPTFEDIASAILLGHPVAIAIHPGLGFQDCPPDGILPDRTGSLGALGHAMCAVGLHRIDDDWYLLVQNSWGDATWGLGGFCYMPRSYFPESDNPSWAIEVVSDESSF